MAWSYSTADLSDLTPAGRINCVRLLVGDTDTLDQQVQNEEITFALAQSGDNIYLAGSWTASAISALYARRVTTQLDGALKSEYSALMSHYTTLSDQLQYQGKTKGKGLGLAAGGLTKTSVKAVRANTNRLPPEFTMDQFKNPPSYGSPELE